MDREALVLRNRKMAEAFHTPPLKHVVRRGLLHTLARLPVPNGKTRADRILLIRPDHLGDVLLTRPAIYALREARPYVALHALVGPWSADALADMDELDAIITLSFPGFSRSSKRSWRSPYELALRAANQIRQIGYSAAIVLRPDHWWGALVAHLAGIPLRIGYDQVDVEPFLTERIPIQHQHAIQQNLRLVERWTGHIPPDGIEYRFAVDEEDRAYMNAYLQEWDIGPQQPIFCIHPGSGTWAKRWTEEQWIAVADLLCEQLGATPVFTGADPELQEVKRIVSQMTHKAIIMVGDTDIGQLAALYDRAQVVLGPDSGPLHLAAAVGSPTVALFGPADPVEFAPWGPSDRHRVLIDDIGCRPCRVLDWGSDDPAYHPCVREITVGRVADAARRVVAAS